MRGKEFYDVMPIAELCQYQLKLLIDYLQETFPDNDNNIVITIDSNVTMCSEATSLYKVPSQTFGQIKVVVKGKLNDAIEQFLNEKGKLTEDSASGSTYIVEESPLIVIQILQKKIEEALQKSCKF